MVDRFRSQTGVSVTTITEARFLLGILPM